jgi:hypothetical protein
MSCSNGLQWVGGGGIVEVARLVRTLVSGLTVSHWGRVDAAPPMSWFMSGLFSLATVLLFRLSFFAWFVCCLMSIS